MNVITDRAGLARAETWGAGAIAAVALCFAVNMVDGMDVTILSYVAPVLQQSWSIDADTMGTVFSAGLLGMALGGVCVAPLADRFGRRPLILTALVLMSGGMIASGFVARVSALIAARILVGIGIGTVLAAMAALTAEVAPSRQQSFAVGVVQAGYPLAAVFTGIAVARLLPSAGWQPLLLYAGVVTLVMLPLAALALTESRALGPVGRDLRALPIAALFRADLARKTLLLFTAIFMGLMVLYIIVSWITNLAIAAGLSTRDGIYAGALYNLGAFVGTLGMSVVSVRVALTRLVPALFAAAIVALLVFGSIPLPVGATLGVAFLIGVTLQGGYNGIWPLAAAVYPPDMRATGIGWAVGIGRSGAVVGPAAAGTLLAHGTPLPLLFALFCIPLAIAAAVVWLIGRKL
jgi:MFS family permease